MEGPVSGRKIKRRTIRTIIVVAVLIISLVAIAGGAIYMMNQLATKKQQEEKVRVESISEQLAKDVSAPVNNVAKKIDELVTDQKLVDLLIAKDTESLKSEAANQIKQIPHAINLRVFLPGQYHEDTESKPPLGFASLDLLNKAEKSTVKLEAEVHAFNSPDAHVVLIRRVQGPNQELLGLVHVSLEVEPFIAFDKKADVDGGYAELVQETGKTPLVLSKSGNDHYRQGSPVISEVKGTHWRIEYWPKGNIAPPGQSSLFGGSIFNIAALLGIIILAGAFLYLKQKGKPATEEEEESQQGSSIIYGGALKAIMDGQHPGLERLIPNLPKMGQSKVIKPVSKGMQGDDVTMIAKPDSAVKKPGAVPPVKKSAPPPEAKKPPPTSAATPTAARKPVEEKKDTTVDADEKIPDVIFRAYDIRGVVGKTLTVNAVTRIGRAVGSEAKDRGQLGIAVGHDGRESSPELSNAFISGLRSSGIDVIDIGLVPTPVLYFATYHLETNSGVMITGSHNAPEYNGLKIVLGGETLSGEAIQSIRQRIEAGKFASGQGSLQSADIVADYIRRATEDIPVALGGAFKIVIDCGNGVAGGIAPQLFRALGHDVIELFCDVDGKFPNHQPDPSQPANLQALIEKVKETQADIGMAFDGDGDRLGVVDSNGNIIWPDRQMMLFARDVLSRNQGAKIIYDVKCSNHLRTVIESAGGEPVMWKTGHSLIKNKMKEMDAPLAGEMSGHIFFKERWYGFDDAMYAGARMLEILTQSKTRPAEIFDELPGGVATPELRISLPEKLHAKFMQALLKKASFPDAVVTDIDGLRVDFSEGWGLIRPSNTSPCLVARFEAKDEASLKQIKDKFRELIRAITPDLKLPF